MSENEVELICELSPMQQAMLFASLYAPGSGVYVVQLSLRLTGRLDPAAFEQAWRRVVERHDALRTGFHWEDLEKPIQVVLGEVDLDLRRTSWRGLDREEQEARLREFLDADRESGFELSEPPLMRLALFELEEDVRHLVWTIHHLLVDGWSMGLLLKELFTIYAALAAGREPSLPRARSYGEYIAWLQRQDAAAAEAFWRRSLAGLAAPTLMAGGDGSHGRGASSQPAGFRETERRGVRLSPEATASLRELARERRLTLNTLVQGAWALVLAQATGSGDVVFGGTVAGRPGDLPGADSMVGLFINTLPVRVEVDPERPLLPWLHELQERQVEARDFDHAPLHEVQTWSELPAGTALFDNILVFESYPLDSSLAGMLPELSLSRLAVNEITNYPLNLIVYPGAELSLQLVHDAGRFPGAAAVRLLERLSGVLQAFPADPGRPLADVPLLLPGERQQVLVEWNDWATAYPREACLHELFAAVARETPDAPALVPAEGEVWSYRRLAEAASGLARHLRGLGVVRPETRVALCMERSPELVVSVLAVLEAGGAYAPLDASYPDERLAYMLDDTEAPLVLVDAGTRQRLEGLEGRPPLLTVEEALWSQGGEAAAGVSLPPESLALVIYTSGSTGRPKGVALTHRGLVRTVRETTYARWTPRDRVAHLSNISFDAATMEMWGALLNGAALVIIPREEALSPSQLAARVRRDGVTWTVLTTALFNQIVREDPEALVPLRSVMFAGEAADPSAVARMLGGSGPEELLNGYGPAEGSTISTWYRVRDLPPDAVTVPIGRPVANASIHLLGLWHDLVPPGVVGEVFIGGDGVGRGYLNRPDVTAERFVPHPWGSGERLYRTGDLARQRGDGLLEFVGRRDDQVKIRGFRIEPGEIEAVLATHPEVGECAVLARRDVPGEIRIVAYVVLDHPADPSDAKAMLAAWLRDRLPKYMLPSAFVLLDALPLTPNGKVDRKALPAPEQAGDEDEGYAPPADPVEELLAGIWAEVLGRERVGVHHDFFELGGHSLLATQVASRIRGVLGVELPLRSVFETPTVSGLAGAVRAGLLEEGPQAPPLVPVPRGEDPPLSFAQQRLWFIDRLEPGNPGYNIPAAVRLTGDLSIPRLARVFAEVVRRHEVLRTTFSSREGRPVQVIHAERPDAAAVPVVDLAALPLPPDTAREALARRLAREESLRAFDLETGPLLRVTVLRLDGQEHLLLLTLHHIISDGWSMGVLVREVQALYRGLVLPELPIQYTDFAAWQRQWLDGGVLERQLAWWREYLDGTSGVLELPTDHPRPAALSLRGAEHRFALGRELSHRLVELGRREGATPFMILASALFALLSRLSGQRDLNLASPIANRNRIETEGLIGFFVNTLVLRARVGREASFLDLLFQVREASLGAYAHQDLPFEKLVDEVQPERDLSRSPLVQAALAFNNAPVSQAEIPGLRLVPEAPPAQVAKFDLAFYFFSDSGGDRLAASLEYATDLYGAATAARLARQLVTFLDELTADPERPLHDLSPLTAEERHQVLLEWNDTAERVRPDVLLHQLFEERVDAQPEALAAVHEREEWSYRELEARANRLAHFLMGMGLVGRGAPVGVWMERSLHMLASVLGILKAGGTYVPLDAAWPADRVETILASTGAPVILAGRSALPAVEKIRWRLPRLGDAVCLDFETPEPELEPVDTASVRSLFDFVAERATDRITAGGFIRRDTGLPFAEAEVDEYRDRVLSLAAPWLRPDARVLEVGSGSGLILWEMAKRVERCVGLDPSPLTQERNREHAREEGIGNVELPVGFAHEIAERFAPGSFDLVVLASTVQFFPGPRYLEKVVADALRLLAPGGALLVADVIDARIEPGTDRLALDEELFHDLGIAEVHRRNDGRGGFANELGERYDVILRPGEVERRKRTWTGWHVERASSARPAAVGSPEDIAYVIHTSGSTGMPKGIAVQHAPAVNLIGWVNRTSGAGPGDRLLFVTSLCFDLSVYDIFGTLAAGGTVHVASEAALREPGELVRLLREEPVTIWDSAPAALQQLAPLFPSGEARPLRLVMLSGDWIPVPLPDQVRAAFPGTRVMSLGGATEATVWSNWYPVGEVDPGWPSIPYGRPIANARYHVLDEAMLPCPIGVPGDLYIGGSCLCVGYAGQPELTAAAFLPDPYGGEPGARLYRTGDRSRFFRDGNLEFLGRVDQQVKVRGYRIELGEIEVALLRHPDVREAVAAVLDGRLVAWAVLDPKSEIENPKSDLAAWLHDRLPQYMIPSAIVLLDAMPVTANGKLDRKALPEPEWGGDEGAYEAPSDPVEETLAGLWADLLGLERVGVRDNFFTLGGHSLLATQLMSRIRGALGVELQLRDLFEAPTIAELARTVRRAGQEEAAPAPPALAAEPRDVSPGGPPLSFAQQRLWLIDQLDPGDPAYNVPLAVRLSGALSVEALERAFAEVVRRHAALRTTFAVAGGEPVQVIAPPEAARPGLRVLDLSGLPEAEREERARELALEEARSPFDLQRGPLLRLGLLRLGEREHLLLVTLHHIVSDGWSMGVLLREIGALYPAFLRGEPSPLPELPLQYADFARWQRGWMQGEVLKEQLAWWRERLAGAPRVLELPTDHPRPAVQTFRGASRPVTLSPVLTERVRELGRREGVTPFMILVAAWAVLLGRHADQDDLLLGTTIAGRGRREVEDLIGFFVNTVVLRVRTSEPSFRELLQRARETVLDAFAHQDVPFERLVEELVPERDLAHSPLFQAAFALGNAATRALSVPGLSLEPLEVDTGSAKFDLALTLAEGASVFSGVLEHSLALFDGSTAARLLVRFEVLLEAAVRDPEQPPASLPLLGAVERHQMLLEWNDREIPRRQRPMVHELFSLHARRRPEAVAVDGVEGRLTYGELEARSNRLAHHLRGLGVGPEVLVALCTERTPERVVGIVGVMKAGGAYVSLDPTYPRDRLAFLLDDARAPVLLTQRRFLDALPDTGARVICLDADEEQIEGDEERAPVTDVSPDNLAYVVYTSGSTGKPKGVETRHAGLMDLVCWHQELYEVTAEDRATQITSPAFDASVWELWPYLAAGASVHIPTEETRLSVPGMVRWWSEQRLTLAFLATSLAEGLLEERVPPDLELRLRTLIVGGDRLHRGPERPMGFRVMNNYGPAEYTVTSTAGEVPLRGEGPAIPTIGRPVTNTQIYLLDRNLEPVPIGVPGEMFLAGVRTARGYLRRPELTAEKFLPNPWSADPGERMYRTGDLVRLLPDGEIDFLGRLDHQVKIRGLRIELGEIESVLDQHPGVREAVVLAREDRPGQKRLVGYLVPAAEAPTVEELRRHLGAHLPEYMVPPVLMMLESLPLTANGKVDRRALPVPEHSRDGGDGFVAPSDAVEEALAGIWAEVLKLEDPGTIGVHDDFFTLGGHSLLATQVVSRIRIALGVDLPLRRLFTLPTIAELAQAIREEGPAAAQAPPVTPVPRDPQGELPLSFAQQRLWLIDQLEPDSPAYNIPLAVRMSGELSVELLRRIFAEIVRRHEALRTTFAARDGRPLQVIAPDSRIDLPIIDLSCLPDGEREARVLARDEMVRPFSLEKGPLLRLTLVRMADREHLLLLTLHHIIADGWSMGVLLREIGVLYEAFAQGRPSPLPDLPVQYADFAVWQRSWMEGGVLEEQLGHWKRLLAGAPRVLELPADRPRPPLPSYRGATRLFTLPPALYTELRRLCEHGVTPFMALLAAWTALLGRHAGQEDVLVGSPVANRNRREIEDLIGFFVNTLVFRSDLAGAPSFRELLERVRGMALEAFSQQDLPFERLVEEMVPERDLAHSPLIQVLFVLQNVPAGSLKVPGLTLTPLALPSATSKFDLLLNLAETGEGGLTGGVEYSTDLFDEDRIDRLLQHLAILLAGAAAEPERPLAELPLLTEEERNRVLFEWNDNAVAVPPIAVHAPVEEQAERTPEALAALWTEDGTGLTYRELNRQANQLAHHLRALGVGPDERVAISLERSLAPLVAVLAVLKAGGAYVPIDPDYPADRVAFLLSDSRSRILVDRVFLDSHREAIAAHGTENPARLASPGHLAYVIYTSGSTGRPKGVAVPHGVLANMLAWQTRASAAGPGSRTLQFASLSFDVSFQEIFSTWWTGGTVVALPQETRRDAMALCQVLDAQRVERLFLPFVALHQIAEAIELGAPVPAALTEVVTAGEQLQVTRPIAAWLERSGASLENHYGPTEGHVVTAHRLAGPPAEWPVLPPIGRPLPNVRMYLLDRHFAPVPQGVPGHLCFGGAAVVRGYLDRPDLTAERFIPDPFGGEPGGRLYTTGDRAQFLADGALRFLGRIDQQVKIRGFRVEPGEVESALTRHPAVRAAAVVVHGDGSDRRLVGYYVADEPLESGDLRAFLAGQLPDSMVPALLVRLDALPLTPSGKLDRRSLPDPRSLDAPDASQAAPSDLVEELLAGIWAELLRRGDRGGRVGVHDDFFALGGHSLLATQVISRVRTVLGVELPLRQLFETPTVAGFARAVRTAGRSGEPGAPLLASMPWLGAPPLSFAQQRLWLIDQLEPGNPAYNIPLAVRLSSKDETPGDEGELSVAALERTFAEVVRRHAVLRTTFAVEAGRPVQVIAPPGAVRLELRELDLSDAPEEAREEWALQLAFEEARAPFDLARGPLLRLGLLRLAEREHILLVTFHHIVSDGWSMGVLLREIGALYPAFVRGEPSPLPELPLQYADFARWQRAWLQGEVLERQLGYWKQKLAGAPQVLELPTDRPRPAVPTYGGASIDLTLPPALTAAVRELCGREQVTPFMLLLAAWAALLGMHAEQEDVLVGTPIAGRNRQESEDLIGFFVNTLVLRTKLSGAPAFRGLLGRVREAALDAFAHQDLPFELLVDELGVERSLAHTPLVQVMLTLQNAPVGELRIPGLTISPVSRPSTSAKLDLALACGETAEGFAASLEYATDLFDRATAERFLRHLTNLLASAAEDPGRPLSDLRLMDAAEERLLQAGLNRAERTWALPVAVHELLTRQAGRIPDRTAAVGPRGVLTYGEIEERSTALAGLLRSSLAGVPLDRRIGLLADPDPQVLIGMIGILKAGGGFVPVDPRHPDERMAWILEDSGCEVLVTERRYLERAAGLGLRRVVCLDQLDQEMGDADRADAGDAGDPRALAYAVYTSGSTGRPKGVQISHESLVPMLLWGCEYLGLGEHTRVLQSLSFCFDFGIFEHLTTLLAGGTLVFPGEAAGDPAALAREIARHGIDTLHMTPAFARELAAAGEGLDSLETVHLGGEALSRDTVERIQEAAPRATVYNGYGPTEATINSSIYRIDGRIEDRIDESLLPTLPIGRRSADNALYILDRAGRLVPYGMRGELHVGGIGVARGYLNRPELTAERFVPDPFGAAPGGRLYRTGDLVRYLSDGGGPGGDIEFLGRIDHQIKLRGFRIELGEIEAVLAAHPQVRESVVVARTDTPGDPRLVAYAVLDPADPTDPRPALFAWLREKLPEYMVPAALVLVDALPLTDTGKVDRRALPAPLASDNVRGAGQGYVAPSTPLEEKLAAVWAEVLRLDRVGVHDNFFSVGGHSLLATQLMSRLREVLRIELPLRALFAAPTIAELARVVSREQQKAAPAPPSLVPARSSRDARSPEPLSFSQQRLWFIDQLEPGNPAYNLPLAVRLTSTETPDGGLSVEALERTFAEVVRRHDVLRTTFAVQGGRPVQVIAPPAAGQPELRLLDLSDAPEEAREEWARELAQEEARSSFDLARGPLLRLGLLRLAEREHILLVTLHHIVSDGWSMSVLLREVGALYPAFRRGEPSPLPELPLQYADFARWQREWLQGEVLERQIAFWKETLAGAPALLELPTDRPRPAAQTYRGAAASLALSPEVSGQIQELCRKEELTPFMVLLAAWAVLLGRHAGQEDVLVGSPIAGRNREEIENLIGFFVNTLVLRSDLSGNPAFRQLLGRVRETALDAFAHQDLPFELLVDEITVERSLAHTPLIQVMLNFQNAPAGATRIPGLALSPIDRPGTTAKFDLALAVGERAGGERAGGFSVSLEYATDLFDRTTAERFLRHLANLLASAVEDPGRPLSDLRLMDAAEERLLQAGLNHAERTWARPAAVHELFARQANRIPDRTAAVGPRGALTYREIDERSTALAGLLRSFLAGVPLDRRIGLLADPDPQVLAGMIGILKAGGGFVPVDPRHPDERVAWLLEDSACEVLVTDRRHLERAKRLAGPRHVLCLDEMGGADAAGAGECSDARSLAYVVYTSGSTGRPKGVQVSHESLVPMLLWGCDYLRLGEHTRVLQSLSFCFDFGIFEHLTTLIAGGTLVFPGEAAGDPAALAREIARHGIDTLHMTPAFARELAAAREGLDSLEIVHLGGESLSRDTVERIQEAAPRATVYNGYGPTEATINSSIYRIEGRIEGRIDALLPPLPIIPIGRRSADNALYILDRAGRLVPYGARGELHVGGVGVARGYLGRPELTAERFVPDPFGATPGGRLYRTGDLVRYLPGGDIEFLGRIDDQVKLRGFRIELGEIEAVLRSHPEVSGCAALVRTDAPGDPRLVAYVVLDPADRTDPIDPRSALVEWLRERLPEYMVPAFLVLLDALPLTATGKVDRKALPAPEHRADASLYVAPEDEVEERLVEVWQEILRLDRVGVQDNFFAVGGNSLLATQLVTRMREALGLDLPVRRIFEAPTIRQLGRILRDDQTDHLPVLQEVGSQAAQWEHGDLAE